MMAIFGRMATSIPARCSRGIKLINSKINLMPQEYSLQRHAADRARHKRQLPDPDPGRHESYLTSIGRTHPVSTNSKPAGNLFPDRLRFFDHPPNRS